MSGTIEQTLNKYFDLCNEWDFEGVRGLLSDDFAHEFRPASLGGIGIPVRNVDQFVQFVGVELKGILKAVNFTLPPKQVIVADKVAVAHVFALSTTIRDTTHENEFLFIFHFDDNGKISYMKEFMDSKSVADELAAQAEFKAAKAAA